MNSKQPHVFCSLVLSACASLAACAGVETAATQPAAGPKTSERRAEDKKPVKVEAGDLARAQESYEAEVQRDPANLQARLNLGLVKERRLDLDGARSEYQAVLKQDSSSLDATLALARVLAAQGKTELAEKLLGVARKANGDKPVILNALAGVARAQKKHDKAIDWARKVLLRDQKNIDALATIALSLIDQGRSELAEVYCNTALAQSPNNAQILATLGYMHWKKNDHQRALAFFQKATESDPDNAAVHANIGFIALSFRDYQLARVELDKAASLGRATKEVLAGRCYAMEGGRQDKDAAACLTELAAKVPPTDPDLPGYLFSLGMIHQNSTRDKAAALVAFKKYVDVKGPALAKNDRVFELIKTLEMQQAPPPAPVEPAQDKAKPETPNEAPAPATVEQKDDKSQTKKKAQAPGSRRTAKRVHAAG